MTGTPINSSPSFESQGRWSDGYLLAKAEGPGVTVGPGAGNPNVFVQSFNVDIQRHFRIVVRAASVGNPRGKAVVQVNWLGEKGSFLSSSQKYFAVTHEETAAEYRVSAPEDALAGVMYVVPGGDTDVVHYTEMSLYPDEDPRQEAVAPEIPPDPIPIRPPLVLDRVRSWFARVRSHRLVRRVADRSPGAATRPEDFWRKIRQDQPLIFVHIPKTAGYSVYDILKRNYPEDAIVMPHGGVEGNIATMLGFTPAARSGIKVYAGHMPMGLHRYIGEAVYVTFLRDPFEMAISEYYFNLENRGAPTHNLEVQMNRTLLQFAEYYDNMMTRYLMTCSFRAATYWLSGETKPGIKGVSAVGLECPAPLAIRTIALQQWNAPLYPTRYPSPGVMEKVAVECSDDRFAADVRVAAVLSLRQDRELHAYAIPPCGKGRFWRIRALAEPDSARWGVVALKLFEQEHRFISAKPGEHRPVSGIPLCSSAAEDYPASQAFDGRDLPAQWQIPPGALEMCHCEEAMHNLRDRFLIGLTERCDESLRMIGRALGWSHVSGKRLNASNSGRTADMLSRYERKQIAEINRFDIRLYRYAQRLFQGDLAHPFDGD